MFVGIGVAVGQGVRVGVLVRVGVFVGVGVLLGIGVGGFPSTVNCPLTFQIVPTNI